MAKIIRLVQKVFGRTAPNSEVGQFGSQEAGNALLTKDPATIQALSQFEGGWGSAIDSNNKTPNLEDWNGLANLITSQISYYGQSGVPEYDVAEEYFVGSICRGIGNGKLYYSRTGTSGTPNKGNALSSTTDWKEALDFATFEEKGKNLIINGNFDIWQRGTSSTSSGYLADRFVIQNNQGSGAFTQSRQEFTLGQTDVPNNPRYFHRTAITTAPTSNNDDILLSHRLEDVRRSSGRTVTLSFWARGSGKKIRLYTEQNFGIGGSSPVGFVIDTVTTASSGFTKFEIKIPYPSIAGKTIGTGGTNVNILFTYSESTDRNSVVSNQIGTFDIAQVQVEYGDVVTEFEGRDLGTEFALCQRYYEEGYSILEAFSTGLGIVSMTADFKVAKAKAPTMSIQDDGSVFTTEIWSTLKSTIGSAGIRTNRNAGNGQFLAQAIWKADAEI